jgi:hypothetical protein
VFTEEEVTEAIKSMKRKKAVTDMLGLSAELFQATVREFAPIFTELFNKMWISGKFSSEWSARGGPQVQVFKKGDAGECTNYGTIAIGPALRKLYAKLWWRGE